ncbi:MAG TPA: NAD(P)-dependent oxidoreductase, partial [Phototrophicaceae bacterium]|nr:NAD(P)-dependent oxidoreductase [Phototrophicaceae bacterium]
MMNPVSTVAITGATGYVGRFVVAELQRHGVQIRALARPQSSREGFDGPIGWIEGDLRSVDRFPALVDGVDAVIHLAYEHVPGRYRGGEGDNLDTWLDANLNGSLKLLTAARDAGVKRFVFLSSRAVFSKTESGRVLDETHPVSPDTHYGAYKVAVEAFLQSFAHTGDMKTCSIRSTGVYGMTYPVERSKWWNLIQTVVNGEPVIAGDARGGTEVHGDDVARVIWSWLTQSDTRAAADVIHLSDLYVTHREVVRLARELVTQALANCPGELPALPVKPPENQLVS